MKVFIISTVAYESFYYLTVKTMTWNQLMSIKVGQFQVHVQVIFA